MSAGKFLKKLQVTNKILTLEQQNKGPVMSMRWSYVTPMMSYDIM